MKTNYTDKKPFKLEQISKKEAYSVPDDYFKQLPSIIQTKAIESTRKKPAFEAVGILRLAIPSMLLLMIVGYFGYRYQNNTERVDTKIEMMLADVSTEEMVSYLGDTDLSSDDLLELVSFEGERIDDFELELNNLSDEELELLMDDFELEDIENI